MRKATLALVFFSLAGTTPGWAQQRQQSIPPESVAEIPPSQGGKSLSAEIASLKPEVGILEFTDATGGVGGRFAAGLGADVNLVVLAKGTPYDVYYGISTGAFFAHLGDASSGFFGSGTGAAQGLSGANMALIPVDLKLGYDITDLLRVSVHGGGNVFYRSVASSMAMGVSSATTAPSWDIFPNVGGDVEWALGQSKSVAVFARPDFTITPGVCVFLGTVGVSWIFG